MEVTTMGQDKNDETFARMTWPSTAPPAPPCPQHRARIRPDVIGRRSYWDTAAMASAASPASGAHWRP